MFKRSSFVDSLKVDSLQFSSIIQLGDSHYIRGTNLALAEQREEEIFFGQEGDFSRYRVFSEPLPLPLLTEHLRIERNNHGACGIKVGTIKINGVSSSSLVHIGNSKIVQMEARIKHIRHLLFPSEYPFGEETEVNKDMVSTE